MKSQKKTAGKWRKLALGAIIFLIVVYSLLLIPGADYQIPIETEAKPFLWDRDELWNSLEGLFREARLTPRELLQGTIDSGMANLEALIQRIEHSEIAPEAMVLDTLEATVFHLASQIAACPDRMSAFIDCFSNIRTALKQQSNRWDMSDVMARHRIYRLLYGGRAAVEEIMLQLPQEDIPDQIAGVNEPSATPQATLLGVRVHSGDILISRGGAPTSALIARGNDYPGNFSHIALVHVDSGGKVSIIESHIESGVSISTIDDYLGDSKLRVVILRPRADLPDLIEDPMLPHKAATFILAEAQARHIPYDFEMDFEDEDELFCSEVASAAYRKMGIRLWMGISRISSMKLRNWLAALGVRYFTTQEPSDLEYDPQLQVVAEWLNTKLLYKDHLDNAVLDAMLEGGDSTATLEYDWYMLPLARCIKGYSVLRNFFGSVGPIPEGMAAKGALRVDRFSRDHEAIKIRLIGKAESFKQEEGYTPPYWVLVRLAEEAEAEYIAKSR
jgi:hypothetical protein